MAKRIQVGGRIESKEVGGIVTGAAEILDDAKGKKQSVINGETDDELLRLDQSKQDNLTFDNAPTEGSDNPVKSGGLYTAQQAILLAIAAINELIPSAASVLNQLADKAFVNSSISTNTATFRGTSAAGLNEQQFLAWANGLEHDLNDYVFWQTPDAAGNTLFKRYKWNGTEWAYEYTLNNSTFTAEQWEAIQSGITALLVAKLRALPTAEQLIQSFDGKQDVLTFDNVPTLGSTNPVKSSGIFNAIKEVSDALNTFISETEALIPAEATAQNQLADKADVAAKIVASIPSWKGQYDALTDLQAVTGAKAGDMGCVKTTDSDGHAVLTFYQYSAQGAWVVYYTLRHYAQNKPATTGTTGDYAYNGMGRIELQKNIVNDVNTLTQAMLTQQNTIYVIQYDFTLGEDINIPANCVLEFDGGSLNGAYKLTGNNTGIHSNSNSIFGDDITILGTWSIPVVYADWIENVRNTNNLRKAVALLSSGNKLVVGTDIHNLSLTEGDSTGIGLPDNTELQIEGEIKANTNNLTSYTIVSPGSNCYIHGGKVTGDKDTSEATSGEHGHGFSIWGDGTIIENVEISQCWGDGVYVARQCIIKDCSIHDCRRQGISVTYGTNIKIICNDIYNISGTAPQCCIDVEPNDQDHPVSNLLIQGNKLRDSVGGLAFIGTGIKEYITISDNIIKNTSNSTILLNTVKHVTLTNNVTDNDFGFCNIVNSEDIAISNNVYTSNTAHNYTLGVDEDSKNVVVSNNIFNLIEGSEIRLRNCMFTDNILNNAGIRVLDGALIKGNYINGTINIGTTTGGDISYITNNDFYVEGEGQLFAFMTYNAAKGSVYFCENRVTINFDSLRAFYYCDTRYASDQLFDVFVEMNNTYDVPFRTNYYPLKYTKGYRTNNYDIRRGFYDAYYNTLILGIGIDGIKGLTEHVYDSLTKTLVSTNADGLTGASNSGTTTQRPTSSLTADDEGFRYFDKTLHKPIWYRGDGTWIDATGATV